jgi:hypothetical protein
MYIIASLLDMVPGHFYATRFPFTPGDVFLTVARK